MVTEKKLGQMAGSTRVTTETQRKTVLVLSFGQMATCIRVTGVMTNKMEKGFTSMFENRLNEEVNGRKESEFNGQEMLK